MNVCGKLSLYHGTEKKRRKRKKHAIQFLLITLNEKGNDIPEEKDGLSTTARQKPKISQRFKIM